VKAIRETLLQLHKQNVGYEEGAQYDALGKDDGSEPRRFPQLMHPRNFAPWLRQTRFHAIAAEMAREILGGDVRFKADISMLKPAVVGPATPWHQDEAFHDPRYDSREVSFWLALQPTDKANSCMEFLPGSHLGPVLKHGYPAGDSRIHALECVDDFDRSAAIACPLPAGGCTLHLSRTLHYAGPNISPQPRLAYVLIFDLVPVPRAIPREFPWLRRPDTARAQREKAWRRHGGLLVHLWRQRTRIRPASLVHLAFDLRRAARAFRRLLPTRTRLLSGDQSSADLHEVAATRGVSNPTSRENDRAR
jgi:hypothetical protein